MKKLIPLCVVSALLINMLLSATAQASCDLTLDGTFTGSSTSTFTDITCDPNVAPVTLTGWVEATGLVYNGAVMFGLVDIGLIDSGDSGWGSGAYAYFGRIGTNVRVGPSDGFYSGELNQVGANVPYAGDGPNLIEFSMTIYDGQITVSYGGVDYVDTYGEIEDANSYDAYPGGEFDFGAYVAINSWPETNSVDYEITICGCQAGDDTGPVTAEVQATPNPAAVGQSVDVTAEVDDSGTGGSNVVSAEYSWDGGATWYSMDADTSTSEIDSFDSPTEYVAATFTAPSAAGIFDLCVRGTDEPGNTGPEECVMLVVYDPEGGFVTGGGWIWSQAGQLEAAYSSFPDPFPGSFPSLGYEATSTDEAGDHIAFSGTDHALTSVTVSLTDWACENDFDYVEGSWEPNRDGYAGEACLSTPGSGFEHPITLNIYQVDTSGPDSAVGALIASKTDTFFIPYRPSWDATNCTETGETPDTDIPFGGKWYDPVLGQCVHGHAFTIEFDFSSDGIVLPNEVIFGVEYSTAHHGNAPIGVNGPYNSLNLSLDAGEPTVGTNVEADTVFWDTSYGPFYCDGGAAGADTFRRDAGCWGTYTPVIQFNTLAAGAYKPDPTLEGKATFGFVSKYKKGAIEPTGNTEFVFKAADLNFHSTSYDWLLVTGSDYAKFKGSGTINGAGDYKFMLWAGDNEPDTFRIKIWDEDEFGTETVVYDNGMDQPIAGGQIVVHTK